MSSAEKPDRSNRTIIAILVAFAIACGAGFWYLSTNMQRFIQQNPQKLELRFRHAKKFSPGEKKSFLESHAGFWTSRTVLATGRGIAPIRKTDLIEFKENGIIWEIVSWDVVMPSGSMTSFYQIRSAYLDPYGTLKGDTLTDAYPLHQAFIRLQDTCFGAYNLPPELWRIAKKGESLIVNRRAFELYTGPLSSFFPAGMVRLVGTAGSAANPYLKMTGSGAVGGEVELQNGTKHASTNALDMPDCQDMQTLGDVFREELAREYSMLKPVLSDSSGAVDLLQRYYEPLLLNEQMRLYPWPLPAQVQATFTVSREGVPGDITISGDADKVLQGEIGREIASWHLPGTQKPIRVSRVLVMP